MGLKGNGSKILDTHRRYAEGSMPLSEGKSQKSFVKNLKTEMENGKPQKQSLAIAYAMKRKAQRKKMADGGGVQPEASPTPSPSPIDPDKAASAQGSMRQAFGYADGGFIEDEMSSGYEAMPEEHEMSNKMAMSEDDKDLNEHHVDMKESTEDADDDLVMRIMRKRYSQGGMVANQDKEITGDMPNEFDNLHLRDDLESSYGEDDNAGDDLGNKQEDEDRSDMVDRIMLKNFKQKIPRGYPGR